ncbi:hypothetical protein [uncultured Brevundimonas sp.]|uniref:hypothetical protein n=1 Tax=uncultured Brevundimonas sp. TaxID=213418 RepID=UPI0025FE12BB|nr:hypothetical protein [uncultured Brevundimonas sp.]
MSFRLSSRSRARLIGVHPALTAVVEAAITRTPVDFMITEGLRTAERQAAPWSMPGPAARRARAI